MDNKLKISITMDPGVLKRADAAAKQLGMSRSEFIAHALEETLQDTQDIVAGLGNKAVREAMVSAMMQPGVLRGIAEAMGQKLSPSQLAASRGLLSELRGERKSKGKGRGNERE